MGTPLPTSGAILRMEKMTNNAYSGHSINDPQSPITSKTTNVGTTFIHGGADTILF